MLPRRQDSPWKKSNSHAFSGAVFLCFGDFCDLQPSFLVILHTDLTKLKNEAAKSEILLGKKITTTRLND